MFKAKTYLEHFMYRSIACLSRTTPRTSTRALFSTLLLVVLLWAQLGLVAEAVEVVYYVDPDGVDCSQSTCGTESNPFATLQHVHDMLPPVVGDDITIFLRGRTYALSSGINFTKSGTKNHPIKVYAYVGEDGVIEKPVLDGSGITTPDTWVLNLRGTASWWHIKGLEIRNNPHGGGILVRGTASNNIIENNNIHHNGINSEWAASGISVYDSPANNLFLNNDVHNNKDIGGCDADGISAGNTGSGNVYRGNRAWQNSDVMASTFFVCKTTRPAKPYYLKTIGHGNGYELTADGTVVSTECDSVGVKLGGKRSNTKGKTGGHMVKNNVSWKNGEGFDDQNSSAKAAESIPNTMYNNTAWSNGLNYVFWADTSHIFSNNLSLMGIRDPLLGLARRDTPIIRGH